MNVSRNDCSPRKRELAYAMEATPKDILELQGNFNESEVNKINKDGESVPRVKDDVKSTSNCHRRGGNFNSHKSTECYLRSAR